MGVFDDIKDGIISGARPVVIEVWRSIPQSNPPLCSSYDFNAEVPRPRQAPSRPAPQCAGQAADAKEGPPPEPAAESKPVDTPPKPARFQPVHKPGATGGDRSPPKGGSASHSGQSEAPRESDKFAADKPSARARTEETPGKREAEPRRPTRKSPSRRAKTTSAAKKQKEEEVVELLTSEDDASKCSSGEDSDYSPA